MTVRGEFESSVSDYGTYDQGGNVWEWCEDILQGGVVLPNTYRLLRGGSFDFSSISMEAASRYYSAKPRQFYRYAGFRVVD